MNTLKYLPVRIILMLLLGLAMTACNKSPGQIGVTSEIINYGVRLKITSDKAIYHPGDTVHIAVSVENVTQNPIEYPLFGNPPIYVDLEDTPYALGQELVEKNYEPPLLNGSIGYIYLNAKESISRKVIWDQQIQTNPNKIQAPAGTYRISGGFMVGHYTYGGERTSVSASIEIQVADSWQIILPDKALEIARNIPEVATWVTQHSGPNLVKYENGQYYIYILSDWQKVDPDFTGNGMTLSQIQQSYEPDKHVLMVGNHWEVHFFTKMGPAPNEIIVTIEPTTGNVISIANGK